MTVGISGQGEVKGKIFRGKEFRTWEARLLEGWPIWVATVMGKCWKECQKPEVKLFYKERKRWSMGAWEMSATGRQHVRWNDSLLSFNVEERENVLEIMRNRRGTLPSPRAHVHTRSGRRAAAARGGWKGISILSGEPGFSQIKNVLGTFREDVEVNGENWW